MKISQTMIATAMIALMPLAVLAGDKDKSGAMSTSSSQQFKTLDSNGDGRISPIEASSDSKIVFSTADRNQDGFLDSTEFSSRDKSHDSMSSDPAMPKQQE